MIQFDLVVRAVPATELNHAETDGKATLSLTRCEPLLGAIMSSKTISWQLNLSAFALLLISFSGCMTGGPSAWDEPYQSEPRMRYDPALYHASKKSAEALALKPHPAATQVVAKTPPEMKSQQLSPPLQQVSTTEPKPFHPASAQRIAANEPLSSRSAAFVTSNQEIHVLPLPTSPAVPINLSKEDAKLPKEDATLLNENAILPIDDAMKTQATPLLYQAPFYRKPQSPMPVQRTSFEEEFSQQLKRLPAIQ